MKFKPGDLAYIKHLRDVNREYRHLAPETRLRIQQWRDDKVPLLVISIGALVPAGSHFSEALVIGDGAQIHLWARHLVPYTQLRETK